MKNATEYTSRTKHCFGSSLGPMYWLLALFLFPLVSNAAASLMVTPSRVVFDERTRTAQITLMNQGDETGEFRISFIRQQMTESGRFVPVETNEEGMYSDTMIRYSPRQITLPPGQSQVVRLMLRKPRNLADGEYRSHMLFQTLPKPSTSRLENQTDSAGNGISVEIIPLVGISIPVIVRHGKLESQVAFKNAHYIPATEENPVPRIALEMHRSGNQSVYGDIRAVFIPNSGGTPITVGMANGVAVYTPNSMRTFTQNMSIPEGVVLQGGKLRILYLEPGKDEAQGLLAETQIDL